MEEIRITSWNPVVYPTLHRVLINVPWCWYICIRTWYYICMCCTVMVILHRVYGIFAYLPLYLPTKLCIFLVNVGKYASTMEALSPSEKIWQGFVNVPWIGDLFHITWRSICWRWHIPNSWVMWKMRTFTNPCLGEHMIYHVGGYFLDNHVM